MSGTRAEAERFGRYCPAINKEAEISEAGGQTGIDSGVDGVCIDCPAGKYVECIVAAMNLCGVYNPAVHHNVRRAIRALELVGFDTAILQRDPGKPRANRIQFAVDELRRVDIHSVNFDDLQTVDTNVDDVTGPGK